MKEKNTRAKELFEKEFGKIFFVEEKTFGGIAVFLHSTIASFLKLIDSVFPEPPVKKFPINLGFYMSGIGKFDNKTRVHLIWVNSKMRPDPISAVSPFVHEISHMVDTIIDNTGINDSSGEVRSYLIERYTDIVMGNLGLTGTVDGAEDKLLSLESGIAEELKKTSKNDYEQVKKST